jgi:hypothetical protein
MSAERLWRVHLFQDGTLWHRGEPRVELFAFGVAIDATLRQESAKEADILAAKDVNTLEYREMKENDPLSDRSENNPLRSQGFWTSPWSVKIKIMRQLVDWNRASWSAACDGGVQAHDPLIS